MPFIPNESIVDKYAEAIDGVQAHADLAHKRITRLSDDMKTLRYETNMQIRLLWVFAWLVYAMAATGLFWMVFGLVFAGLWAVLALALWINRQKALKKGAPHA